MQSSLAGHASPFQPPVRGGMCRAQGGRKGDLTRSRGAEKLSARAQAPGKMDRRRRNPATHGPDVRLRRRRTCPRVPPDLPGRRLRSSSASNFGPSTSSCSARKNSTDGSPQPSRTLTRNAVGLYDRRWVGIPAAFKSRSVPPGRIRASIRRPFRREHRAGGAAPTIPSVTRTARRASMRTRWSRTQVRQVPPVVVARSLPSRMALANGLGGEEMGAHG